MIRIVIAECLLAGLLGAILYRLAQAISGRRSKGLDRGSPHPIALGTGVSGVLDPYFCGSSRQKVAPAILTCWLVQTLRAVAYLFGAFVADRVVKKRESLGFDHQPPDKP